MPLNIKSWDSIKRLQHMSFDCFDQWIFLTLHQFENNCYGHDKDHESIKARTFFKVVQECSLNGTFAGADIDTDSKSSTWSLKSVQSSQLLCSQRATCKTRLTRLSTTPFNPSETDFIWLKVWTLFSFNPASERWFARLSGRVEFDPLWSSLIPFSIQSHQLSNHPGPILHSHSDDNELSFCRKRTSCCTHRPSSYSKVVRTA